MSIVRCLAADALWRDPLLGSARGTVESSFAHAVNVRFDDLDQALLTLTTAAGRPAPGALLTEVEEFARYSPGTRVRISQGVLHLAGLRLGLDGCSWFDTRVRPLSSGSPDPLPLRAFLADAAPPARPGPFEEALAARLHGARADFRQALAEAPDRIETSVTGLIGLGVGLTPTGDDYLVGALAVLSLSGSPLLPTLAAAVRAHAAATTTVGRHFLLAAADGRFHHDVTLAATAALTGSATAERDYARLAELGSTSGTDTLTGIHDTLVVAAPAPGKDLS